MYYSIDHQRFLVFPTNGKFPPPPLFGHTLTWPALSCSLSSSSTDSSESYSVDDPSLLFFFKWAFLLFPSLSFSLGSSPSSSPLPVPMLLEMLSFPAVEATPIGLLLSLWDLLPWLPVLELVSPLPLDDSVFFVILPVKLWSIFELDGAGKAIV